MSSFRYALLGATLLTSSWVAASPVHAAVQKVIEFNIPSQNLGAALNELGRQAGIRIAFPVEAVSGRTSFLLRGKFTPAEGARRLVAGSAVRVTEPSPGLLVLVKNEHANSDPVQSDDIVDIAASGPDIVVIGSALRSQEAVENRRQSAGVVDTLSQDDTGDLADETLADALIRVPGVDSMQALYGEQEAAYVTVRGITPDLNATTFDGMTMFSSSFNGDGVRRVDLNLIPTQISRTTQVFKTFTADLEAGAIGGVTNIIPRSALNGKDTFYIDTFVSYQADKGKYVPGMNSLGDYNDTPWGGGVKGLWSHKFGADGQFGIVLSGVYRQKTYDLAKRYPGGHVFYTSKGAAAAADLSNWDGLQPLPSVVRTTDTTQFVRTFGGSAQLEWEPAAGLQLSLLGYEYKQIQDQTMNQFYLEQYSGMVRTGDHTATLKVGRSQADYDYDHFTTETRGAIFKVAKEFDGDTSLEARAGWNTNKFTDTNYNPVYLYTKPSNVNINFDMSGDYTQFTVDNYDTLTDTSKYKLNSVADRFVNANMDSYEGKIDFKKNYASGSRGFGFATGLDVRRTSAVRDRAATTYVSDGSTLGDIGIIPQNFSSWLFNYPVVWVDYAKFAETVKPKLGINQSTTTSSGWSSDYSYQETIMAAYASLMYATDTFRAIGGLRYDDADYTALSPIAVGGRYDGTFERHDGRYGHLLPSVTFTQSLTDDFRLKAAYSRTLGRPAFGDIARAVTRNDETLTISRGNPDLKPRRSDNFDLAAEYYFGRHGLVSLGGFVKNIKDDIYSMRGADLNIDGVTYEVTQPMNALSSKIKGVEFQVLTDKVPGLPGFLKDRLGVSMNATRMWGAMDFQVDDRVVHQDALQYQPDWLLNASAFYRLPHKGELRVAYNWKSKSPITLSAYPWQTYWLMARGQLDASFRYSLTDDVIVKLQAVNILRSEVRQDWLDPFGAQRYEIARNRSFQVDLIFKR